MLLIQNFKKIVRNKIILYALTRYFILGISFITSIFLAAKLGPYYFGIWGFVLLLLNYFQYFDFGISDSVTVLLVQNKDNVKRANDYETNSILLSLILGIVVVLIAIYYSIWGISTFNKYNIDNLFYFVCLVAILFYLNKLFFKTYRVKGKVFEFGFYQSINAILIFIAMFFAKERQLIYLLISAYIVGHSLSLIIFIRGGEISIKGRLNLTDCLSVFSKGFLLFIYNFFFYMILLSTRTIISIYYSVEEFGYFTFSYTLANSILLVLDAFAVLIIPKVIDRLYSKDVNIIDATIKEIKTNYVYLSYALMFLAVILFPILMCFLPKYSATFQVINMLSLAIVISTNSFGYSMYLRAINKEKILAKISILSLLVNIVIALLLVLVLKVGYSYVVISIIFSYFLFAFLSVYFGKKEMNQNLRIGSVLQECMPVQLLVPSVILVLITILNIKELIFLPLVIFIIFNVKSVKEITLTVKKIFANSKIFDIN